MAHHCVQPWQVLATHSPVAGLLGLAARGTKALVMGVAVLAQPEASRPTDAPDARMRVRLVNLMACSCSDLSTCQLAKLCADGHSEH
jgi:hypothetical protein